METTSRKTQCPVSKILQRYIKELKLTALLVLTDERSYPGVLAKEIWRECTWLPSSSPAMPQTTAYSQKFLLCSSQAEHITFHDLNDRRRLSSLPRDFLLLTDAQHEGW